MFQGMSNPRKDQLRSETENAKGQIDDWMNGQGGTILGAVVVILVLWFVAFQVWQ
jgi:hypothetical protein